MARKKYFIMFGLMVLIAVALSGCGGAALGTEENPIIWALVPSSEAEEVLAGFEQIADMIFEETGLVIETFVGTSNTAVIEALCGDPPKAHMAAMNTFSTVLAVEKGCVEVELVSTRYGTAFYTGQIFAHVDSGIETVADISGKTFCRDDETSTSSWIIPSLELRAAGIDPDTDISIVDAGSHTAAVAGVYDGTCDAGASYVDARSSLEEDFPDVMDMVKVIFLSGDIPNDGVQYQVDVPREIRDQINAALIKIAGTEEGKAALADAYQWDGLVLKDYSFYEPFIQALEASGLDIEALTSEE